MVSSSDCSGYFKLENNMTDEKGVSTMTDHSTTNNDTGKIGKCRTFGGDGTAQYLSIADGTGIMEGTTCSVNCWAKTHNTSRATRQALFWKQAANVGFFIAYRCDTNDCINYGIGNGDYSTAAGSMNDTNWHMYTLTYNNSTGASYLYLDGTKIGDNSAVKTIAADGVDMRIGMIGSEDFEWDGEIDEIGFFSTELSQSDINQLYNSGSGLTYPFTVSATVSPSTLTLSTTRQESVVKINVLPVSFSSSLNVASSVTIEKESGIGNRATIGKKLLNKHYVDKPYIFKNGVARDIGYYK